MYVWYACDDDDSKALHSIGLPNPGRAHNLKRTHAHSHKHTIRRMSHLWPLSQLGSLACARARARSSQNHARPQVASIHPIDTMFCVRHCLCLCARISAKVCLYGLATAHNHLHIIICIFEALLLDCFLRHTACVAGDLVRIFRVDRSKLKHRWLIRLRALQCVRVLGLLRAGTFRYSPLVLFHHRRHVFTISAIVLYFVWEQQHQTIG